MRGRLLGHPVLTTILNGCLPCLPTGPGFEPGLTDPEEAGRGERGQTLMLSGFRPRALLHVGTSRSMYAARRPLATTELYMKCDEIAKNAGECTRFPARHLRVSGR